MPIVGDRARGDALGRSRHMSYVYVACPICANTRWIQASTVVKYGGRCTKCSGLRMRGARLSIRGANNPAWKGGRTLMKTGYIRVRMLPGDPFWAMSTQRKGADKAGYLVEHRLVMARHLGRCLEPWEVVHHKNGDKTDNRIENLELLPNRQEHMAFTLLQQENQEFRKRIAGLEGRVAILEAERVVADAPLRVSMRGV